MRIFILALAVISICCLAAAVSAEVPEPLSVTNRALGGGDLNEYTHGVTNGVGLNNIGLLVRTWGKVTAVNETEKFFYIDDGSSLIDSTGHLGVRVSYDNLAPGNTITPPLKDTYVLITGISSTFANGSNIHPNLRPRYQADIQTVIP